MFNGKKVLVSMLVIMMVMCFCVKYSYSQEKPSEEVMEKIIVKIEFGEDQFTKIHFDEFIISNSFTSNKNNRYCIEVNYIAYYIYYIGNRMEENKRYSFEKKGNLWYGWQGWGPGEE